MEPRAFPIFAVPRDIVVDHIFSVLDTNELATLRHVSRVFRDLATESIEELNLFTGTGEFAPVYTKFVKLRDIHVTIDAPTDDVGKTFSHIPPQTRELSLGTVVASPPNIIELLRELFGRLPALRAFAWTNVKSEFVQPVLDLLSSCCPLLRELELYCSDDRAVVVRNVPKNLSKLCLRSVAPDCTFAGNDLEEFESTLSQTEIRLSELDGVMNRIPANSMRTFKRLLRCVVGPAIPRDQIATGIRAGTCRQFWPNIVRLVISGEYMPISPDNSVQITTTEFPCLESLRLEVTNVSISIDHSRLKSLILNFMAAYSSMLATDVSVIAPNLQEFDQGGPGTLVFPNGPPPKIETMKFRGVKCSHFSREMLYGTKPRQLQIRMSESHDRQVLSRTFEVPTSVERFEFGYTLEDPRVAVTSIFNLTFRCRHTLKWFALFCPREAGLRLAFDEFRPPEIFNVCGVGSMLRFDAMFGPAAFETITDLTVRMCSGDPTTWDLGQIRILKFRPPPNSPVDEVMLVAPNLRILHLHRNQNVVRYQIFAPNLRLIRIMHDSGAHLAPNIVLRGVPEAERKNVFVAGCAPYEDVVEHR